jgi:hypothetical protein
MLITPIGAALNHSPPPAIAAAVSSATRHTRHSRMAAELELLLWVDAVSGLRLHVSAGYLFNENSRRHLLHAIGRRPDRHFSAPESAANASASISTWCIIHDMVRADGYGQHPPHSPASSPARPPMAHTSSPATPSSPRWDSFLKFNRRSAESLLSDDCHQFTRQGSLNRRSGSLAMSKPLPISRRTFLAQCSATAAATGLPLWFIKPNWPG